jgi:predicted kinase
MVALLQVLVGPIASGKSTYCRQAASEGAIIVNDDAIVLALHAGNYLLYSEALKPLYKVIENTTIQTALVMNHRVVIDRPNYSISMRRRYIGLAKSLDVPVEIVMFDRQNPEVHAARRTASDNRGYGYKKWLEVAMMYENLYQPPDQQTEQFDRLVYWSNTS